MKSLIFIVQKFIWLSILISLIPTLLLAEELGGKKELINKAASTVTDGISYSFGKLTAFDGIKKGMDYILKNQGLRQKVKIIEDGARTILTQN